MQIRLASTEFLILIPSRDRLGSYIACHLHSSDLKPIPEPFVDRLNGMLKFRALNVKAVYGEKRFSR